MHQNHIHSNKYIEKFLTKINSKKKIDITKLPIEILRDNYEKFTLLNGGSLISVPKIEDIIINIKENYSLALRIYTPKRDSKLPVVIYFHGGSWHFGNHTTHDVICRHLSVFGESIIISVDWRLAPEYNFPAPIEDFLNTYNWVRENIDKINGDKNKIIFAGDSAGGNIAVASLVRLRKNNEQMPYAQFLIYPALDLNFNSEATLKYSQGFFINSNNSRFFVSKYAPSIDLNEPELSPLKANDFSSFPKAFIVSAEFDPLADDSKKYSSKLRECNIKVVHKSYKGMIHDFLHLVSIVPDVTDIFKEIGNNLKNI